MGRRTKHQRRSARRQSGWLLGALAWLLALGLLAAGAAAGAAWWWLGAPLGLARPSVELSIEPGSTPQQVAQA